MKTIKKTVAKYDWTGSDQDIRCKDTIGQDGLIEDGARVGKEK